MQKAGAQSNSQPSALNCTIRGSRPLGNVVSLILERLGGPLTRDIEQLHCEASTKNRFQKEA